MSPSREPGTDRLFKGLGVLGGLGFRDGETRGLEHASPPARGIKYQESRHKSSLVHAR